MAKIKSEIYCIKYAIIFLIREVIYKQVMGARELLCYGDGGSKFRESLCQILNARKSIFDTSYCTVYKFRYVGN
jgi:hypothetical protein